MPSPLSMTLGQFFGNVVPRAVWFLIVTLPQRAWRRALPPLTRPPMKEGHPFAALPVVARGAAAGACLSLPVLASWVLLQVLPVSPFFAAPAVVSFLVLLAGLVFVVPAPLHVLAIGPSVTPVPAWVKEPPQTARVLILVASPFVFCCPGPMVMLSLLAPFAGIAPREPVSVPTPGAAPWMRPAPAPAPAAKLEEPKVSLSGWRLDTKDSQLEGFAHNDGTVGLHNVEVAVFYLDDKGQRCGTFQGSITLPLVPGTRARVKRSAYNVPSAATDKVEVKLGKVEQDDVRELPAAAAGADAASVSLKVMAVERLSSVGEDRIVKVQLRNVGKRPLAGFRTRLHFEGADGRDVATWVLDTFQPYSTSPLGTEPTSWWDSRPELPVPSGYVRDITLRLGDGGPEGWARTTASVRPEVLGAWWQR